MAGPDDVAPVVGNSDMVSMAKYILEYSKGMPALLLTENNERVAVVLSVPKFELLAAAAAFARNPQALMEMSSYAEIKINGAKEKEVELEEAFY